jgi:hypothetical protein
VVVEEVGGVEEAWGKGSGEVGPKKAERSLGWRRSKEGEAKKAADGGGGGGLGLGGSSSTNPPPQRGQRTSASGDAGGAMETLRSHWWQ